jgi:hypothetical protein
VRFAPGLPDLAAVRAVCAAVSKPVNLMVGIEGNSFTVAELEAEGVRRIGLVTSLHRMLRRLEARAGLDYPAAADQGHRGRAPRRPRGGSRCQTTVVTTP